MLVFAILFCSLGPQPWFAQAELTLGLRHLLLVFLEGKTTILFALKVGHPVKTIPTVGFNLEEITVQGIKLTIWDCGGQEKVRFCLQPGCDQFTSSVGMCLCNI